MSAYMSTRDLHYQKLGRSFFQEVSSLPNQKIPFSRIYADACDSGFRLVSHVTGEEILMSLEKEAKNRDGEVIAWHFVPVNDNRITRVVILND